MVCQPIPFSCMQNRQIHDNNTRTKLFELGLQPTLAKITREVMGVKVQSSRK